MHHTYIVTSLDLHTLDLPKLKDIKALVLGFQIVDPASSEVQSVIRDWNFGELLFGKKVDKKAIKTRSALIYDAIALLAHALNDLDRVQSIDAAKLSCKTGWPWMHGHSLVSYMKMVHIKGLTGELHLNEHGFRTDFTLNLIMLKNNSLQKAGTWNHKTRLVLFKNVTLDRAYPFGTGLLRVSTTVNPPYVVQVEKQDANSSTPAFTGFAIDILNEISRLVGFSFQLYLAKDNKYGTLSKDGKWNGIMRELVEWEADLAVGDLTITYDRLEDVDFTIPYLSTGIGVLYRSGSTREDYFPFLQPLSPELWLYTATASLGVGVILSFAARLSSNEWIVSRPCRSSAEELRNRFTLWNSFWFVLGSLMQQGSDVMPKAIATRVIAVVWWIFTFVIVSSYTANLASSLMAHRLQEPVLENVEDLTKQSKISYGSVQDVSTKSVFRSSSNPYLKKLWTIMETSSPSVFVSSLAEGVEQVKRSNYALLMDSATIDYLVAKDCELEQIGNVIETMGFGFATPKGSPLTSILSNKILKLKENGSLQMLKQRWWKKASRRCPQRIFGASSTPSALSKMDSFHMDSLLFILAGGCVVSCILLIVEFFWKAKSNSQEQRDVFWRGMKKGLKLTVSFQDPSTVIIDPPKEFRDEDLPMTSFKEEREASED